MSGKYILFEGIDGSGKTTLMSSVAKAMMEQGMGNVIEIPSIINSDLRKVMAEDNDLNSTERLMLYAVNYSSKDRVVRKHLKDCHVLVDRSWLSFYAYGELLQPKMPPYMIRSFVEEEVIKPDVVVYVSVSHDIRRTRMEEKGKLDYFESKPDSYFTEVEHNYARYLQKDVNGEMVSDFKVIDIDGANSVQMNTFEVICQLQEFLE